MTVSSKKNLSKSEAYSLIEAYFTSGELPSVFYRRVGLSDNQFYGWRKKYLRDHPSLAKRLGVNIDSKTPRNASYKLPLTTPQSSSTPSKGFARIEVSDSIPAATTSAAISSNHSFGYEICYPNGVVLRLSAGVAASFLTELIRLY